MPQAESPQIQELAKSALKRAEEHCWALNIDPTPHLELLTNLIIKEITVAADDMARDRIHGGPAMAYALKQPFFQNIYWADASFRAAKVLAEQLSSSSLSPPRSSSYTAPKNRNQIH